MTSNASSAVGLKPQLRTIRQLFSHVNGFSVPVYQRSFAWHAEQIEQLISDVWSARREGNTEYFLGNLVVTELPESRELSVIDGQQRLTTLYLLLTSLARLSPPDAPFTAHVRKLRYESRPTSSETLRRLDSNRPAQHASPDASHDPDRDIDGGILTAFNVVEQILRQNFTSDERKHFTAFLLGHVTVVQIELPADTDLNRYFEIMNTRGQQLEQVDIVKARLMSELRDDADRGCFAWVWDACALMDSYVQQPLAQGDTRLRTLLFGNDWKWLAVGSFDELRTIHEERGEDAARPNESRSTSMSLETALETYATVFSEPVAELPDGERFRSTIEFPTFLLHVLKIFLEESDETDGTLDDGQLVKRFEHVFSSGGPTAVQRFCFLLLRCRNLFDAFVIKREHLPRYEDDGAWSLQCAFKRTSGGKSTVGYAHTFRGDDTNVDDETVDSRTQELLQLQSMLRITFTAPRGMHWLTQLLSYVSSQNPRSVSAERISALLREFARTKVRESFLIEAQPEGFKIPRVVFTYLDYLLLRTDRPAGFSSRFTFGFRSSVEHFFPQQPMEDQSGSSVSPGCLNLLGNLALVSVSANSKFSNSMPQSKAANYRNTIEQQSPKLALMAEITRAEGWNDEQVRSHHEEMVALLLADVSESGKYLPAARSL